LWHSAVTGKHPNASLIGCRTPRVGYTFSARQAKTRRTHSHALLTRRRRAHYLAVFFARRRRPMAVRCGRTRGDVDRQQKHVAPGFARASSEWTEQWASVVQTASFPATSTHAARRRLVSFPAAYGRKPAATDRRLRWMLDEFARPGGRRRWHDDLARKSERDHVDNHEISWWRRWMETSKEIGK